VGGDDVTVERVVVLGAGAAVPADCRIMPNAKPIEIDQAALTGESCTPAPADVATPTAPQWH